MTATETPIPQHLRPNEHQRSMNARLEELIPEAASSLVQTPMQRNKWYTPKEEYEKGVPCFIPANYKDPKNKVRPAMKDDYIWMPKMGDDLPAGFYHFSTQEAYIELFRQFQKRKTRKYLGKKTPEQKLDSQIHDLLENRLLTDQPDDNYATRMRYFLIKSGREKSKAYRKAAFLPLLSTSILLSLSRA